MDLKYMFFFNGTEGFITLKNTKVVCCTTLLACLETISILENEGYKLETNPMWVAGFRKACLEFTGGDFLPGIKTISIPVFPFTTPSDN